MYLTDALGAVVENINVIACRRCLHYYFLLFIVAQLDDLVNLQVDAVDGLTTQIQQIKTFEYIIFIRFIFCRRLQVSKDQHGANRLKSIRTSVPPPSGEFTRYK